MRRGPWVARAGAAEDRAQLRRAGGEAGPGPELLEREGRGPAEGYRAAGLGSSRRRTIARSGGAIPGSGGSSRGSKARSGGGVAGGEQALPGEQLPEDHAEREQVGGRAHHPSRDRLGREVAAVPAVGVEPGHRRQPARDQAGEPDLATPGDQHGGGVQVAVGERIGADGLVERGEAGGDPLGDVGGFPGGEAHAAERRAGQERTERDPVDPLDHHVVAVAVGSGLEELDQRGVGAREHAGGPVREPANHTGIGGAVRQEPLHRHGALDPLGEHRGGEEDLGQRSDGHPADDS